MGDATEPTARKRPKPSETILERALRTLDEAAERGFFDNLPGSGKPLDFSDEDNPFIPDDNRLAYRILRNAGYSLPWIETRKEIDAQVSLLERETTNFAETTRSTIQRIRRMPAYLRVSRWQQLKERHERFVRHYTRAVDDLNRKITDFNLTVPVISLQVVPINRQRRLAEISSLLPEVLD